MPILLLVIIILLLIGALPTWSHSAGWGYFPSGGLGLVLVIVVVLLLAGENLTSGARTIDRRVSIVIPGVSRTSITIQF